MEATFQRLGCYTQSFAMAVLPLYKDNGGPLYGEVHRGVVLDRLARMSADLSDDTLYKSVKALLNEKQNVCLYSHLLFAQETYTLLI